MRHDPFAVSRAADADLPAVRTSSSADLGWTSALVRTYREEPETDQIDLPPVGSPQLVLVTGGVYRVESRGSGRWRGAVYRAGSIGLTPPDTGNTLRWQALSAEPMTSVHVHLATAVWDEVRSQAATAIGARQFPNALVAEDRLVGELVRALEWAAATGAPALYADTTAHLLCAHLLLRTAEGPGPRPPGGLSAKALGDVVAYMDAHLGLDVTLEALAAEVGLSKYHFLRQFKASTGSTPFAYLTALRMQRASTMLAQRRRSIDWIAYACGYKSASRFAAAFRRQHGVSPARYRDVRRLDRQPAR